MTIFGFLHTADVHVAVFAGLLDELSPDDGAVHVVDASLLTDARRRHGVDEDLRRRIGTRLQELSAAGAVRVVCTCSTIGAASEEVGLAFAVDVQRVDRPMAAAAVAGGERIAVVASLESTIGPTHDLLLDAARATGRRVSIVDAPCLEAWSHWEAGDHARYFATLASHLESLDDAFDVLVLAQASMAPVERIVDLSALVLSSPRTAVVELVAGGLS